MDIKIGDIVTHCLTKRTGIVKEIYETNADTSSYKETYTIVLWFDDKLKESRPHLHYLRKIE